MRTIRMRSNNVRPGSVVGNHYNRIHSQEVLVQRVVCDVHETRCYAIAARNQPRLQSAVFLLKDDQRMKKKGEAYPPNLILS